VLVHGYGVSGRYMLPLAAELEPRFAVFVVDLPGHGRSGRPKAPLDIPGLADALGDWLDVVGLERPALVANSMGCQVATQLAASRPGRTGPLVLVGPSIDRRRRSARRQVFGAFREVAVEPAPLVAVAAGEVATRRMGQLLTAARSAFADRIEERLPLIDEEAVVVWGEQDGFVSREWAEECAALLPRGRLVAVPGAAHAVHYTRSALVAEIVAELLVEEAEDAGRELARRFPHRDMAAREMNEAGVRKQAQPLGRDARRYEPVVLTPDE
jgi:pimeloyl-ACP methyl ester carboxylesterase